MRRLTLLLSLVAVLASCSNEPTSESDPTESTAPSQTTTTAETATTLPQTTPTAETATTLPQTTTTVAVTTTQAQPLAFETAEGTPPGEFQSFTGTMSIGFDLDGVAITVDSAGIWTADAFECTMSSELGGLKLSESIIATPETMWYDQGNGYEEANLFTGSATDLLGSCPASPLFWEDFTTEDMGKLSGEVTTYNGRAAFRADLTDLFGALSGLGMAGVDSDMVETMEVWIDAETNTVLSLYAEINMPAEFLEGFATEGDTKMTMQFALDNFNDPSLSVEVP